MKKKFFLFVLICSQTSLQAQGKEINKTALEKTYSIEHIHKSLRELIDKTDKTFYFKDEFFNSILKKILQDKQFSYKEKALLFYLMQKKIGYAFTGVEYLPPNLSYFSHHSGKVFIFDKTRTAIKDVAIKPSEFYKIVDSNRTRDAILASNALFLAVLLNSDSAVKRLEKYSRSDQIKDARNPEIFNHYVCMSASLLQNKTVFGNLQASLATFTSGAMKEDLLCAMYAKSNPVSAIRDYILSEKNPANYLAIQTALCALNSKVPEASFKQSVRSLVQESPDPWKTELFKNILNNKIPFNYSQTSKDQLILKTWSGVNTTVYNSGLYILNGGIMEFDPN